jgi:hypothetical protein
MQYKVIPMKHSAATLAIFTVLAAMISPAVHAARATPVTPVQDSKTQSPGKQQPQSGTSLTGCVDEQQGHYVLVDERNLNPIADLVADGFPTEGFAKHVGHKVTVRGTSNSEGTRQVLKVRSIETLSEICAPKESKPVK